MYVDRVHAYRSYKQLREKIERVTSVQTLKGKLALQGQQEWGTSLRPTIVARPDPLSTIDCTPSSPARTHSHLEELSWRHHPPWPSTRSSAVLQLTDPPPSPLAAAGGPARRSSLTPRSRAAAERERAGRRWRWDPDCGSVEGLAAGVGRTGPEWASSGPRRQRRVAVAEEARRSRPAWHVEGRSPTRATVQSGRKAQLPLRRTQPRQGRRCGSLTG